MRVRGILETAIYVTDVSRAAEFYRRLFGFRTLLESERLIALDVAGRNVLLLFARGSNERAVRRAGWDHPAPRRLGPGPFRLLDRAEDVEPWQRHLESEGVTVESVVTWPGGATEHLLPRPGRQPRRADQPRFLGNLLSVPTTSPSRS